jgi:glycine cleavage system H protein
MALPQDLLYGRTHEWVRLSGNEATIGITSFAQEQLGDIVFVELPGAGKQVGEGEQLGNIESVKAVSELFAPLAGEVIAANDALQDHPELVNQDPFGAGWLVRLKVAPGAAGGLLDAAGYEKFLAEESGH